MSNRNLIPVKEFCRHHQIETGFIEILCQSGLLVTFTIQSEIFLEEEALPVAEKWTRLYYELGINPEGLETVNGLLTKLAALKKEIKELKEKLSLYDQETIFINETDFIIE